MEERETCCVTPLSLINPIWIVTSDKYSGLNKINALSQQVTYLGIFNTAYSILKNLRSSIYCFAAGVCTRKYKFPVHFQKYLCIWLQSVLYQVWQHTQNKFLLQDEFIVANGSNGPFGSL